jgi:putative transposase|tara:strand:+ start:291 stop:434 length:144 start_codon:yes stop_codon:yes gene_type:complete
MPVALRPGQRWSLDFMSGTFDASRKFRMIAVNDGIAIVCNIEKGKVA